VTSEAVVGNQTFLRVHHRKAWRSI
jgi:hypothetical protein